MYRLHRRIVLGGAILIAAVSTSVALTSATAATSGRQARATPARTRAGAHADLQLRAKYYAGLLRHDLLKRAKEEKRAGFRTTAAPDPATLKVIRDISLQISSLNGDPTPQSGEVFASTRKYAETVLSGDTVDTDQPVYSVVMFGSFVGYQAKTPSNTKPTGSVLTIEIDAQTMAVTDWGIAPLAPVNLSSLGAATPLPLS
jgi:hypothetical protein